jgi:hypothetical protein
MYRHMPVLNEEDVGPKAASKPIQKPAANRNPTNLAFFPLFVLAACLHFL